MTPPAPRAPRDSRAPRCERCPAIHRKCERCKKCAEKHCSACHSASTRARKNGQPEPCVDCPNFDHPNFDASACVSIVADRDVAPPPNVAAAAAAISDSDARDFLNLVEAAARDPAGEDEAMRDLLFEDEDPLPYLWEADEEIVEPVGRVTIAFKTDAWIYRVHVRRGDVRERLDLTPTALLLPKYARVLERVRDLHAAADSAVPPEIAGGLKIAPEAGKRKREALEAELSEASKRARGLEEAEKRERDAGLKIEVLEAQLVAARELAVARELEFGESALSSRRFASELAAARAEIVSLNAAQTTVDEEMKKWIAGRAEVADDLEKRVAELTEHIAKAAAAVKGALEHDVREIGEFRALVATAIEPIPESPAALVCNGEVSDGCLAARFEPSTPPIST